MLKRSKSEEAAREDIHAVLQSMELASVSRTTLDAAISSPVPAYTPEQWLMMPG